LKDGKNMHQPVLLQEVLDHLRVRKDGLYIDATFGEGGHTLALLDKGAKVLALDWDENQIKNQKAKIKSVRVIFECGNFKDIEKIAKENSFYPVDGVIFDLGLSIAQLERGGRGFSFKKTNEPLDMRISETLKVKAGDLVNNLSGQELYELLATYSEELNSRSISDAIVRTRSLGRIRTVGDLIAIIDAAVERKDEKVYRRIFQALRIAVNDEFENLQKGLLGALHLIKKDGKIAVVTFHSLEDRIVKRFVKQHRLRQVSKKPIISGRNLPFEKSAKLRVIEY
jgi:16S rRNA (cytosine1402-N4)-methyltransferase